MILQVFLNLDLVVRFSKRVLKDLMLMCDELVSIGDFEVLAFSISEFHLRINQSFLISRDQPILNKNKASLPLYLFGYLYKYFTALYNYLVIIIHTLLLTFCLFQ